MATFVWTGASSALWSTGANWSVGGVAQASPPTATDDALVGSGTGATNAALTITAGAVCQSLDFTGYTGTATHNAAATLTIGGSGLNAANIAIKLVAGMTYTLNNATTSAIQLLTTNATATTTAQTITTAGKTIGNLTLNTTVTGIYQLQDNLVSSGNVTTNSGFNNSYLDTNNFNITCLTFTLGFGSTLAPHNSTINLTSTAATTIFSVGALTAINPGAWTIAVTTTSANTRTFAGNGQTFYNFSYTVAGSTGQLTITGSNRFEGLFDFRDSTNARSLKLTSGTSNFFRKFRPLGTSGKLMTVAAVTAASPATVVSPEPWYMGANSTNVSGNTNLLFTANNPRDFLSVQDITGVASGSLLPFF